MINKTTRPGELLANNTWHTLNSSNIVFVFVHGFFSDSDACWTSKNGVRWPDLIVTDDRLATPSVYMAGYYTAFDSGEYKISHCAREVLESLQRSGLNGEPPPLSKPNIIFVCHSLGGIVVRYMIERYRESFVDKNIGLLLIASPSYGADLAATLSGIARLFNNKTALQLASANESLDDLDGRFKDLIVKGVIPNLFGAEAIEHRFPIHWKFVPGLRPIVSKASASRYFGASKLLEKTDHSTCVKPTSHEHVSHRFLVDTVFDFVLQNSNSNSKNVAGSLIQDESQSGLKYSSSPALFEVYTPEFEPFYVKRHIDEIVSGTLNASSLWVHGRSGLGKTAAVRREILNTQPDAIQVYIGSTGDTDGGHLALLREVYYTVAGRLGESYKEFTTSSQIVTETASLLATASKKNAICLVIDEVPIIENSDREMSSFILAIHRLVVTLKQQFGLANVRIVVTSIFDPSRYINPENARVYEQLMFLSFDLWQVDEIVALMEKILESFSSLTLSDGDRLKLISASQGSPRFVKTFFKNYTTLASKSARPFNEVLQETAILLGYQNTNASEGKHV